MVEPRAGDELDEPEAQAGVGGSDLGGLVVDHDVVDDGDGIRHEAVVCYLVDDCGGSIT